MTGATREATAAGAANVDYAPWQAIVAWSVKLLGRRSHHARRPCGPSPAFNAWKPTIEAWPEADRDLAEEQHSAWPGENLNLLGDSIDR